MNPYIKTFVVLALINLSPVIYAGVIDFEDLTVFPGDNPTGGNYYNGNDGLNTPNSDSWFSGGASFNNSFHNDGFLSWDGWAYSNVADGITTGFLNQYASAAGGGSGGRGNYAVTYFSSYYYSLGLAELPYFNLPLLSQIQSVDLVNTIYAQDVVVNGDSAFGTAAFRDGNYFSATFTGHEDLNASGVVTGTLEVILADYRGATPFLLSQWTTVDMTSLGNAKSISLNFFSTDTGDFGINTPTYLALDNITVTAVPEPTCLALIVTLVGGIAWRRRKQSNNPLCGTIQ